MLSRPLIIGLYEHNQQTVLLVPELTYVLKSLKVMRALQTQEPTLFTQLQHNLLQNNKNDLPPILTCRVPEAVTLIQRIYDAICEAKIPLPPSVSDLEFQDWITANQPHQSITKIKYPLTFDENKLGGFGKKLPWLGSFVSYTLILGTTLSATASVTTWGWGMILICTLIGCRLTANYHDIVNGPERRMRVFGEMIDRIRSGAYRRTGRYSKAKVLVYMLSSAIMLGSAYLSFSFSICSVWSMFLLDQLPNLFISNLSYIFATSVAFSHFGRIFNGVFTTVENSLATIFTLSEVKPSEKIDLNALTFTHEKIPSQEFHPAAQACEQKRTILSFQPPKQQPQTTEAPNPDNNNITLVKVRYGLL